MIPPGCRWCRLYAFRAGSDSPQLSHRLTRSIAVSRVVSLPIDQTAQLLTLCAVSERAGCRRRSHSRSPEARTAPGDYDVPHFAQHNDGRSIHGEAKITPRKQRIELRRRLGEQMEEAERRGADDVTVKLNDLSEVLKAACLRTMSISRACRSMSEADAKEFWDLVRPDPGEGACWRWTPSKQTNGYGQKRLNGPLVLAHHIAYVLDKGPIPEGLQLDHTCEQRDCVNPDHLEPVTPQENIRRMRAQRNGRE